MSIRRVSLSLLTGLLLSLATTAGAAELKGWVREAADYPQHQGLQHFFERLKANSAGRFSGKVICCEEMGQQKDVVPNFRKGELDVVLFTPSAMQNDVPELRILNLPFLFRNPDQMMAALNGEVGRDMDRLLQAKGYVALGWFDGGARSFYSRSKLLPYASDFKGLKVRVPQRQDLLAMVSALGAEPSTLAYDKVPTALASGQLDVAENDLTSYYTSGHYKVAPNYTFSYHLVQPIAMLVSTQRWAALSAADKAIFETSAREATAYGAKMRAQRDAELRATLERAGVKFSPFRGSATTISLMKDAYAPIVVSPSATALMVKIMTVSRSGQ